MYLWSKIVAKAHEELWQERIGRLPGAVISEAFRAERISVEVYTETREEALVLQACYGGKVKALKTVDWVAHTAPENTPPLIIRDRLVISASDSPAVTEALRRRYPGRIILTVPAERAFGTGNHATTSTCLRMLCDEVNARKGQAWKLADIGCGTGVLALAGLRLGAVSAVGFDFDPVAVEIARLNIERNGGAQNLELFQADIFQWSPTDGQKADIVLANLFSTVLQKAFPKLIATMRPGALLIISGILNTQAEETLAAAAQAGLKLRRKVTRGKWVTAALCLQTKE